jgi:hypothetical protein
MQSKYKLTRQIPLTTTYYDATIVANHPDKYAFAFYPTSGQGVYTGANTTKGYMASGTGDASLGGTLITSIQRAIAEAGGAHMLVLRDLGRTIFTEYYTIIAHPNPYPTIPSTSKGYFRQVQLMTPTSIGTNGWNGGPYGSTFGVKGFPSQSNALAYIGSNTFNSTSYLTFYIPVAIANIIAEGATSTGAYAIAGGQL